MTTTRSRPPNATSTANNLSVSINPRSHERLVEKRRSTPSTNIMLRNNTLDSRRSTLANVTPALGGENGVNEVIYRVVREYQCREAVSQEVMITSSSSFGDNANDLSQNQSRTKSPIISRRISRQLGPRGTNLLDNLDNLSSSSLYNELSATSGATSIENKRQKCVIWPEWSDADINAEKWDASIQKAGGRDKEKGKSPVTQMSYFDDPNGKLLMPNSLRVSHWKRPAEWLGHSDQHPPCVVDPEAQFRFDILSPNEHLFHSELIRWIISQIRELWKLHASRATGNESAETPVSQDGWIFGWRPWEHIFAISKVSKGPYIPQYNSYGKYAVKLFWLGAWRKILIDDALPFDEEDNLLLPATALQHELWPMLLTKALIKVASLDYGGGPGTLEFGDFSIIHCLTSWLPQTIIVNKENPQETWSLLRSILPEWTLPPDPAKEPIPSEQLTELAQLEGTPDSGEKDTSKDKNKKDEKAKPKDSGAKDKKLDKGKVATEEVIVYEKPQVVVFASYFDSTRKQPFSVTSLSDSADRSEKLREQGLNHLCSHPLRLTQTRACSLEPTVPPEKMPNWKLIRPRVKRILPTSEEDNPELIVEKEDSPIQVIQVTSSFVGWRLPAEPLPTGSRPTSSLSKGSTRSVTPTVKPVEETDENAPDWDVQEKERKERELAAEVAAKAEEEVVVEVMLAADKKIGAKSSSISSKTIRDGDTNTAPKVKTSQVVIEEAAGLAAPQPAANQTIETAKEEEKKEMWMNLENFVECFQSIHVYHKTASYPYQKSFQDMKNVVNVGAKLDGRKSANNLVSGASGDERNPYFLLVDNLQCSEVFLCMSALCRWNDPQVLQKEDSQVGAGLKSRAGAVSATQLVAKEESQISHENVITSPEPLNVPKEIQPASMISEKHFWKSLQVGIAFKRMRTTGVKAVSLRLPPGRHVLKLFLRAPLAYHVQLFSATPFVFGDEETVLAGASSPAPSLTREPLRLIDYGSRLGAALGSFMQHFGSDDEEVRLEAERAYTALHCPYMNDHRFSKQHHWEVYREAFYQVIGKTLGDRITPSMAHALRCLHRDATSRNPFGLQFSSRPENVLPPVPAAKLDSKEKVSKETAAVTSVAGVNVDERDVESFLSKWERRMNEDSEQGADDLVKVVKLQRAFRGDLTRRMLRSWKSNSAEHKKISELLQKTWSQLESHSEQIGLQLIRAMFKIDEEMLTRFPFCEDLRNHVVYTDYNGSYAEQVIPNNWFLVFREVFFVSENAVVFPKLYTSIPTCCLRIFDNDSNAEFERSLGEHMPPHMFKTNKKGYTFLAVAKTQESALASGKWRLRLIGSRKPLPEPARSDVTSSFHVRELRDYYVPNDRQVVLRQAIKVTENHLATIHLRLSRSDVPCRLIILDGERELYSVAGRGQLVLPAVLFEKDIIENNEDGAETRASSRGSQRAGAAALKKSGGQNSRSSMSSKTSKLSRPSSLASGVDTLGAQHKTHCYIIQAVNEKNTWPLSTTNWTFVNQLKALEKEELKVSGKMRDNSPPKSAATEQSFKKEAPVANVSSNKAGGKGAVAGKTPAKGGAKAEKGSKAAADSAVSRPESAAFDSSKAHWTLRVVSDAVAAEDIDVRKDTERFDQIRAIKRAWEELEPGRAERARQSRLKYLNSHLVKLDDDQMTLESSTNLADTNQESLLNAISDAAIGGAIDGDPLSSAGALLINEEMSVEAPPAPPPKEILPPIDLTPFLVGDPKKAVYKDYATRSAEEASTKKQEVERFKNFLTNWDKWLLEEKRQRNKDKIAQMELAQNLQNHTDAYREIYFRRREAYRQRLLEEDRKRQEEQAALEAANQLENEAALGKAKKGADKDKKASPSSAKKGKKK